MTEMRREAMEILENVPEDKLGFVLQILRGVNGLLGVPETKENQRLKRPIRIENILNRFIRETIQEYGDHIKKIILYGSYARGDYREDSDIDIMVLVDYPREKISDIETKLSDISYDISYDNDFIEISTLMQNIDFFNKWMEAYPFYNNVISEGVELYVGEMGDSKAQAMD